MTNEEFEKRVVIARSLLNGKEVEWMHSSGDGTWKIWEKQFPVSGIFVDKYSVRLKPKPVYKAYTFETASRMMNKVVNTSDNKKFTIVGYTENSFVIDTLGEQYSCRLQFYSYVSALLTLKYNNEPVGVLS